MGTIMSLIQRWWRKTPVLIRALLSGLLVLLAGTVPWSALVAGNLEVGSSLPWAFFVEIVFLAAWWSYLGGKGWPRSTATTRHRYRRAKPLRGSLLAWSFGAGTLYACTLVGLAVVGWLLVGIPEAQFAKWATLGSYPLWSVVPTLIMGSIVAGVVEETAFRGYMQVPIEDRHGPVVAIGVVALVFSLAHFPSPALLPVFLVGAVGWGVLAYLTDSILPGILFHTLVDAVTWMWLWTNLEKAKELFSASVIEQGRSAVLGVSFGLTAILGLATVLSFVKLARVRRPAGNYEV